jgi:hypothetical protein
MATSFVSSMISGATYKRTTHRAKSLTVLLIFRCGRFGIRRRALGTWQDPPVYAIVARDQQVIHIRCAEPPTADPNKYRDDCSTRTCPSKMPMHCIPSTQPKA